MLSVIGNLKEMKEGFLTLKENKGLFALLLIGTLYMLVYMPINALYPLMSMSYFKGTPIHVSMTEIAFAAGMLAGGLLLGRLGGYRKRILLMVTSIFMMGFSLAVSGLFADRIGVNYWFLMSGILIIGIAILCSLVPSIRKLEQSEY